MVTITDIKTTLVCPFTRTQHVNLVVVKVETNQPGLYGWGCATFTQRAKAVVTVIEEYLKPLLVGRNAEDINDLWMLCNANAYWRNGPIITSALGGIDLALWDIKGKMANMPVYQLLGGRCREAMAVYVYAFGNTKEEVLEDTQRQWEAGFRYIRPQIPLDACNVKPIWKTEHPQPGAYYDPRSYLRATVGMFEYLREKMGFEPEFLHDVHEKIQPVEAIQLAKELEPIKMFFLEDLFSPEQANYLRQLRQICTTPIALGELFVNQNDWLHLVTERLIDYMRIHITMVGGLTAAVKIAHICEAFGVRLAWHGPNDLNPVGHAAQMHIDIASNNFGIKEWSGFNDAYHELFDGIPELRNGYAYLNDRPGFGIEFNEKAAKKYPFQGEVLAWTQLRRPDGTHVYP